MRFSPQREQEIIPFTYLPFGAGPRVCIGKSLALMQMALVLATVIQRYELSLPENEARRIRIAPGVSARPIGDITILLKRINACHSASSNEFAST